VEELIAWVARGLVDEPDAVRVERLDDGDVVLLRLHVAPGDVGKVIGRQGRVVRALRTIVRSAGARGDRRATLEIVG
jgi:predicted RNA-binding protein YlqC (UPF0109 family)